MKNLFITKKCRVVRDNKTLKIEGENIKLKKIPIKAVKSIYVFGSVEFSYGARNLILENSKNVYFFNHKGKFSGCLSNGKLKSNYRLRLIQYKNIENLEVAKYFVERKIEYIEEFVKRSLNRYKEKLKLSNSLNEVLGVEGSATLYMFEKIKEELNKKGIEFQKREYRPAKDKVNGLFSFAYTLFYGFLHPVLVDKGFDSYIGFLHRKRGKHMAFVSDMMECYRVQISVFVMNLLLYDKLSDDDFDDIYLNYEGRRKFLRYYVEFLEVLDLSEVDRFVEFLVKFK